MIISLLLIILSCLIFFLLCNCPTVFGQCFAVFDIPLGHKEREPLPKTSRVETTKYAIEICKSCEILGQHTFHDDYYVSNWALHTSSLTHCDWNCLMCNGVLKMYQVYSTVVQNIDIACV